VKLGLTVSPRTVRRYMPSRPRGRGGRSAQSWATFLHNHAGAVLACDFFIVVTATFQRLYVFVLLDIGTRRLVHWNLTDHPGSEWTIQQFRNGLPLDGTYRFLVHDRGGIFAPAVDAALRSMSLQVLKTPVRVPQTNDSDRTSLTSRSSCRCSATPRRLASSLPAGTGRRVNFAEHSSADVYIWVESATEHVIRKAVLPPQQS